MLRTTVVESERPRDVNIAQAASILYGDWGTSKAYVIGLAFALAGYSAFWLIAGVSFLNILLGLNYIIICRCYPNGGGVYASVRRRSEILALVGGFFLVADYIVTASLSALSAFQYLGMPHPEICALVMIGIIGMLNYLGPRHTGNLAFMIALPTVIVVSILGILSFFHLEMAIEKVQPLHGGFEMNWGFFVSIIVALSGIEAIANSTGVMQLDPGSTSAKPSVAKTSTPAILMVMFEVWFFTTLFGLAMNALPNLVTDGVEVSAPGYPNVRDAMLRYMAEVFGTNLVGPHLGHLFGIVVSITFCVLLLSAVNTAIVALVSLIFVMSRDRQLPRSFQKLNSFGVPKIPLIVATIAPIVVLIFVDDVVGLANLYAVGFVGAIATNLASTSTDYALDIRKRERYIMFASFLIMAAIEISLFIYKPEARAFVISILAIGLLLRGLVLEQREGVTPSKGVLPSTAVSEATRSLLTEKQGNGETELKPVTSRTIQKTGANHIHMGPMLCAVTQKGKALEFAIQECARFQQTLHVLFIREEKVIIENQELSWLNDPQACEAFDIAIASAHQVTTNFIYANTSDPAANILKEAKRLKVSRIIVGIPRRHTLLKILQGDVVEHVRQKLPSDIDLVVIS